MTGSERWKIGISDDQILYQSMSVSVCVSVSVKINSTICMLCSAGSRIRSLICPYDVKNVYSGYVAWRGTCGCENLSSDVYSILDESFSVYRGKDFHILAYKIPKMKVKQGDPKPEDFEMNWVWYENHTQLELSNLLTDKFEKTRRFSVPRGYLHKDVSASQKAKAERVLPFPFATLGSSTENIFLQVIHDLIAPTLTFAHRIALIGDAACLLRPHTAAGSTKAAVDAWRLGTCLIESSGSKDDNGGTIEPFEKSLQAYEEHTRISNNTLHNIGVEIGNTSQGLIDSTTTVTP